MNKKPIEELKKYLEEIVSKVDTMKQQVLFLERGDEIEKMRSFVNEANELISSFGTKMRKAEKSGEITLIADFSRTLHDLNDLSDRISEVIRKKVSRRSKNIVPQMAVSS